MSEYVTGPGLRIVHFASFEFNCIQDVNAFEIHHRICTRDAPEVFSHLPEFGMSLGECYNKQRYKNERVFIQNI